jgi:feruloyl esterase
MVLRQVVKRSNRSRPDLPQGAIVAAMTDGMIAPLMALAIGFLQPNKLPAQSCERLMQMALANASHVEARTIISGTVQPNGNAKTVSGLPTFCRVTATLRPTPDSQIGTEVWLPQSNWNGKFLAVGSGGWGGSIAYAGMADALRRGYATSATDDGHTGEGASFVVGHPQKLIDFAYRAEHEMTLEAKILIKAFYGHDARLSYWNGCSGGGREGLLQAYRYPDEFNGIIAGDPANIRRNAWALWLAVQTFKDPVAHIPSEKYPMIHRAVLDTCDGNDGLKDGLIEDPKTCHMDFKKLECKGADGPDCLTARQVKTADTIISPAATPAGEVLFPRLEPGTELRWNRLAGGPKPADLFLDEFRYVVYKDPQWDWRGFNLERDAAKAHAIDKDIDELDPHLSKYAEHGGKLLIYHGWADQQVAPGASVQFYNSVVNLEGDVQKASKWIRLFMVPGMAHCSGGEGPDTFDKIGALDQWVEHGIPPSRIVATQHAAGQADRQRPLCSYPQVARYNGSGSIEDASSFTCSAPNNQQ